MLRDGLIVFEGDADALRNSDDEYIRTFLHAVTVGSHFVSVPHIETES